MNTTALTAGSHFTKRDAQPYTLADGTKGVHETTIEYVVTSMSDMGFEAKAVRLIDESNRPDFAGQWRPGTCAMIWLGWDAAVRRGDVEVI